MAAMSKDIYVAYYMPGTTSEIYLFILNLFLFLKDFIYLFLERVREGERKGDKR